jgi:initiation factor 1A
MVKNLTGGNKAKKQKRNFGRFDAVEKIEIGQMYAQIIKNNGGFFDVLCSDGVKRRGKLCGDMKKGPRLKEGSFVVVTLRDFETDQKNCDIIYYGNPPNDIMGLFKKTNTKGGKDDIDFVDDTNAFNKFEEPPPTNETLTDVDWNDI